MPKLTNGGFSVVIRKYVEPNNNQSTSFATSHSTWGLNYSLCLLKSNGLIEEKVLKFHVQ